jgi:hypothetical protein
MRPASKAAARSVGNFDRLVRAHWGGSGHIVRIARCISYRCLAIKFIGKDQKCAIGVMPAGGRDTRYVAA